MIAKLKPYPTMKDSGVEWLGEVPGHWEVSALRRKLKRFDGIKIGPFGSQLKLDQMSPAGKKVYGQANVIRGDFSYGTKFIDDVKFEELRACEIKPGDLVLTMMGTSGRCALVPADTAPGIMDSHLLRVRLAESAAPLFVALLIDEGPYVKEQVKIAGKGSIMHGLNSAIVKDLTLALPPLPEQTAIVRYLDYVDRRVRRLVRAKRKLIALLTEQKQAIIHRAVTRGLDPDVPMKDSGVEWLGEVPGHWEVVKIKHCLIAPLAYGVLKPDKFGGEGAVPIIRILDIGNGLIDETNLEKISPDQDKEFQRTRIVAGDVLISVVGTIGRAAVVPASLTNANLSRALCRVQLTTRLAAAFLYRYCSSSVFIQQAESIPAGTAQKVLNLGDLRDFDIAVPPPSEQAAIVGYLDQATADIDTAITRAEREIELLNEYRTRLIADVVTGKLDVREAAAALPEVDPLAEADNADDLNPDLDPDANNLDEAPEEAEA